MHMDMNLIDLRLSLMAAAFAAAVLGLVHKIARKTTQSRLMNGALPL